MRIAIADDEAEIREQLTNALVQPGHSCDSFCDGQELIAGLQRDSYDVVLLDWNMPRATGLQVLNWAKETLESPPAFVLITSRSDELDVVDALKRGASDYLIKPQTNRVIVARTEAAAKSAKAMSAQRHSVFGRYKVDRQKKTIDIDGKMPDLSAQEFHLAVAFFSNLNRPLSRHYLNCEWSKDDPEAAATDTAGQDAKQLDRLISRIRFKLALRPQNGVAIQTVFGFGYRMDAV